MHSYSFGVWRPDIFSFNTVILLGTIFSSFTVTTKLCYHNDISFLETYQLLLQKYHGVYSVICQQSLFTTCNNPGAPTHTSDAPLGTPDSEKTVRLPSRRPDSTPYSAMKFSDRPQTNLISPDLSHRETVRNFLHKGWGNIPNTQSK